MAKKQVTPSESIVAYKGFGSDWKCRDFQYELGKEYTTDKAEACSVGFHACEYPLHVLRYYKPGTSKFAVVEQSGTLSRHEEDSKVASTKIAIKAEISLAGLINASVKYTMDRATPATGGVSDKANTVVKAVGKNKSATASGYYGAATASGDSGAATASGDYGAATASGNSGAATASGRNGKAKGNTGCALFLVERDGDWKIVSVWAGIAGQGGIKADTFYKLVDGKPVEVAA